MNRRQRTLTLLATIVSILNIEAQVMQQAPRLVVNITIDQLRADYMEAFSPLYTLDGFKKLANKGMVFTNASYPFSPIDRASAIASVSTGTTPYYNSLVGNQWLDRETLRPVQCVDDKKTQGLNTSEGGSPNNVSTSTIGDELKVTTQGKAKVFSIAPFRNAAIMAAGHAADGAVWIDDKSGNWCTTDYYGKEIPQWIKSYNAINPTYRITSGGVWEPENQYVGKFNYFLREAAPKPFKHKFTGERQYIEYKTSGLVNENVTKAALHCVSSNNMGVDGITDLLNVTYYAGPFNHEANSETQIELQDTYVRLDRQIASLIASLELRLGAKNVLFVITSTGYSDEEDVDYSKYRIPSGTFYINRTAGLLNMYFSALWGQGKYVEAYYGSHIYLNHKLFEGKRLSISDACQRAQEFLSMVAGVRNVFTSQQLLSNSNPEFVKVRNGFCPERCGEIIVEVSPGWRLCNEDTQQSQLSRASYTPFPIIFYGANIQAERITIPVTVDRIAPTVAKCIRIRAPNACSSEPLF
ncbi:MAG: alkaline phosphatase family protein [Prevotella sp.]